MDMDKLAARVIARRAAAGLIAACGTACATQAEKDYLDRRHALMQRDDWGHLPPHLVAELIALRAASLRGAA